MILKLNEGYNELIMKYLKIEENFNRLLIGDIKRYGYDNYFFNIWGNFDTNGSIRGLLIQYFDLLTIYSIDNFNLESFIEHINKMPYRNLNGKISTLKYLEDYINFDKKRMVTFCMLKNKKYINEINIDENVKKIRFGKINKILKLYEDIDEFEKPTIKSVRNNLKSGRGYYIEEDKKIVSMAKTTAESDLYAMVIGVGTHPKYRNRGYATKCMVRLCKSLIDENKIPCLFYDNEEAGKIYKKIGFKEIDQWVIYYK
ncbi:acetyltransferase [[Clostridium] sordellii]|uniref:GNAT family N-acetyltransferase n=1 Tax=Paraclostridium sordellii TaxID=1505 RepID=UPI0005E4F6D1|nr:GNAT family N-acetyltransferase [Paeniclostridium sordellii]CEQ12287.1 acetyltransferase [[Clostridium] sordellii] [Paeniclostridium sordellii]